MSLALLRKFDYVHSGVNKTKIVGTTAAVGVNPIRFGDRFARVASILERVLVTFWRARSWRPAVHAATFLTFDSGSMAGRSTPRFGTAARAFVHRRDHGDEGVIRHSREVLSAGGARFDVAHDGLSPRLHVDVFDGDLLLSLATQAIQRLQLLSEQRE